MNAWIPVEKMLPKRDETVLAQTGEGKLMIASYSHKIKYWRDERMMPTDENVIAWTPIPTYRQNRKRWVQDLSLSAFPALPCDTVYCEIDGEYVACYVSEVTWECSESEPSYTVFDEDTSQLKTFTASDFGEVVFTEEQYCERRKNEGV